METTSKRALVSRIKRLSPFARERLYSRLREKSSPTDDAQASPTDSQKYFWLLDSIEPQPESLNLAFMIQLVGEDPQRKLIEKSIQWVVGQNDIFRQRLIANGDEIEIVVADEEVPFLVHRVNITAPEGNPMDLAVTQLQDANRLPFDLSKDLPIRTYIFTSNESTYAIGFIIHHVAFDGSSLNPFWDQITDNYEALSQGRTPQLLSAQSQYRAYQRRQTSRRSNEMIEQGLQFWKEQLAGANGKLELHDRRDTNINNNCEVFVDIPLKLLAQLETAARLQQTTPYILSLAAFYGLLQRHTGQKDIMLGAPTAIRPETRDESVVGCTLNMICLRQTIDPQCTYQSLVDSTRTVLDESLQHADYPYWEMLSGNQDPKSTQFEAYFQYGSFRGELKSLGQALARFRPVPAIATSLPLTVEIRPDAEHPTLSIKYDTQRISRRYAQRLCRRYLTLLESAIKQPNTSLCELALLDADERKEWQERLALNAKAYPSDATIHNLVEQSANGRPSQTAILFGYERITFGELIQQVNQVAANLSAQGICTGQRVGVSLKRHPKMIVAILATMRCGAAYVPLPPENPSDRIQLIVADAELAMIITDADYEWITRITVATVSLDSLFVQTGHELPAIPPTASEPAYIMYTSGSTGKPKGVVIEHRSAVNFLDSMADELGIESDDRLLALTTISFDISVLELFLPLIQGAEMVLGTESMQREPEQIIHALGQHDITHFQATPTTWQMLIEVGWKGKGNLNILCGGESMGEVLAAKLLACGRSLWNLYGPTETTVWSTIQQIHSANEISIGHPIANTTVLIVDRDLKPVLPCVVGEILIGGDGLAREYWRRDQLTAKRFIHLEIGDQPMRLYRTGDLGRYNAEGHLECLGRMDHQIKIRGHRIEIEEIERVVNDLPINGKAVVVAHQDPNQGTQLVTYYTGDPREGVEEWKQVLLQKLPAIMVPRHWVNLETFPKTASGKVDRKMLAGLTVSEIQRETVFVEPRSATESKLLQIWQQVFNLGSISCTDDFFSLGGNSLSAVRFTALLKNEHGFSLTYHQLFTGRTIQQLAATLDAEQDEAIEPNEQPRKHVVTLRSGTAKPTLVMLHGMGGEMFDHQKFAARLEGDNPIYGVMNPDANRQENPAQSFEELTEIYCRELLEHGLKSPFCLFGYSLGGFLAFAVAHRFQTLGMPAQQLYLIDAIPTNLPFWLRIPASINFRINKLLDQMKGSKTTASPVAPTEDRSVSGQAKTTGQQPIRRREFFASLRRRYIPKPLPINTILFRSTHNHMNLKSSWGYLTKYQTRTIVVDREHHTFMDNRFNPPFYKIFNQIWHEEQEKRKQPPSRELGPARAQNKRTT